MFSITYFCRLRWKLRLLPCCCRAPVARSCSAAEFIASTWRAAPSCIHRQNGAAEIERDPDLAVTQGARRQAGRAAFARVEGISKSAAAPAPLLWTAVDCSDGSISGSDALRRMSNRIADRVGADQRGAVRGDGASNPNFKAASERRLITPSVRADAYGSSCRWPAAVDIPARFRLLFSAVPRRWPGSTDARTTIWIRLRPPQVAGSKVMGAS